MLNGIQGGQVLTVVTSQDPQNDRTNYGDLARYIECNNNCAVIESGVLCFDLLYQGMLNSGKGLSEKHGRVSEYDRIETFSMQVIQGPSKAEFSFGLDCTSCVPWSTW